MLQTFAVASPITVSLPAQTIFKIGSFPITNAVLVLIVAYILTTWLFIYVARGIKHGKKNRFIIAIQWLFEVLYKTVEEVTGSKEKARRLAPMAITMFFLVVIGYYLGLMPWVGSIKYGNAELFRGGITDLNFTFALAIISMTSVQIYAIRELGIIGNLRRYFRNPIKDPTGAFEGILELISEFYRGTALSLRLFGNVFAGEILIAVIAFMTKWLTPLSQPFFLAFEFFIGAIQSYVFFMLTIVFIALGSAPSHGTADHKEEASAGKQLKPSLSEGSEG